MKIYGIVAEYNPFHNGHLYQIEAAREAGITHIVAVMSGNFVQRGDVAILDKFTRARLAIQGGVDLVLELPTAFALSSAEGFSRCAISILNALSCIDGIIFGSECDSVAVLKEAAQITADLRNTVELRALLKSGRSYPGAMQLLAQDRGSEAAVEVLSSPNNLLAIEYIKAINHLGADLDILPILRKGIHHDSPLAIGEFASASRIRQGIFDGEDMSAFLPKFTQDGVIAATHEGKLARAENLERAILFSLRGMSAADFKALPDVGQGLENRLLTVARDATTLEELFFGAKTKRYTMAKLRRIALSAVLGLSKSDAEILPPYARVLALNDRGCEVLKLAQKRSQIPIGMSLLKLRDENAIAANFAAIEAHAGDIYALATEKIQPCGSEYTAKIQKM